jgi:hypothetical protein
MTPEQAARVDTHNGTLTSLDGQTFRYVLETRRRWNIGLRKHVNELTGRLHVTSPDGTGRTFSGWADVFPWVEKAARWALQS